MKRLSPLFLLVFLYITACSQESIAPTPGQTIGQGGSMARFAVVGHYLYTVDHAKLNLFDISQAAKPIKTKEVQLGIGIETIFPYQDKLFIGSQTGMFILDIKDPASPKQISSYEHTVSCDPVVTDGRYAYITLRSGTACRRAINELQVLDIRNAAAPALVKRYAMVNPKGLGIDQNLLFVCDDGLKVYDATNVLELKLLHHFKINAYDVIPQNGHLLVIGSDGFYQYRYSGQELTLLSKLIANQPQ